MHQTRALNCMYFVGKVTSHHLKYTTKSANSGYDHQLYTHSHKCDFWDAAASFFDLCLFTTSSRATEVYAASKDGSQAGDVGLYLMSDVVVNYLP